MDGLVNFCGNSRGSELPQSCARGFISREHLDGLVQHSSISSMLAMEIVQFCTESLISCFYKSELSWLQAVYQLYSIILMAQCNIVISSALAMDILQAYIKPSI